jgi:transcriptional regulator with GAF, ATPase, and Fis domain
MRVALVKSGWRIHGAGGAAELLGLKPTTLISRMKKLGLKRPEPTAPPQGR